tara:strand:+ start:630 stop:866 length:237 start_codon:yes stop_codon:yes gene_type:complete
MDSQNSQSVQADESNREKMSVEVKQQYEFILSMLDKIECRVDKNGDCFGICQTEIKSITKYALKDLMQKGLGYEVVKA